MKRIISTVTTLLFTLFICADVNAASFSVNINGSESFDSTTTLTVGVENYSDISLEYGGIMVVTMDITYDESKIDVTVSGQNGFSVLRNGSKLVIDRDSGVASGSTMLSMNVTNKTLAHDESTTITLSNIVGSDSDKNATASNATKKVKYVGGGANPEPAPQPQPNPTPNPAPAPSSNTKPSTTNPSINGANNTEKQQTENSEEIKEEESKAEPEKETKRNNKNSHKENVYTDDSEKNNDRNDNSSVVIIIVAVIATLLLASARGTVFFVYKKKKTKEISLPDQYSNMQ